MIIHLPFVNLGAKFQPNSFDAHPIEAFCLQHILARLSLILHKPQLFRLSTLPCYVSPMKLDGLSYFKSSSNLKELWRHKIDKRKSFVFPKQYRNCFSRRINALLLRN